ncbi:thioredoxin domain-containing protein [Nesterenkonia flava]|uniref:DUF255 domain-containing protein n=1 Tax=Nesterenkonia flava TaxID=469799 RepID=A0ABU1FQ94_9MICC|nr:DUF255 domain-containing protein [Nesterenkonia flava]MDR5710811.1 DUF255 domain-containing protein [Nesterenkonia flava]
MANRLASAQSAYLRQHAENPVNWWPWGREAFAEAKRRDVPLFVSIGYAACHWCHVMAGESFADEAVAEVLNERFVCIKVDREERPDVDDAYMAATQAMTGQGGWPMSVFALPDGRVFHAGTYFPPRRVGQVPSFTEVLDAVHAAWTQRRAAVERSAEQIAQTLSAQRRQQSQLATAVQTPTGNAEGLLSRTALADLTRQAMEQLSEDEDTVHGGFGAAPKFPPSALLGWLLEEGAWDPEGEAARLARRTCEAMARSALFDQVEGGFARYATDRAWALPHFEKMLYDNAQLLGHYARLSMHPAADAEERAAAERIARMSIDWLRLRMQLDSGLLASSLDADTVDDDGTHVEGSTYLFSDEELITAAQAAGLSEADARSLAELNRGVPADEHALRSGQPLHLTAQTPRTLHFDQPLTGEDLQKWQSVLPELRRRRAERLQPGRDEKVVAAWNAQAVASLAQAAALWQDDEVLSFATELGERLWEVHVEEQHDDGPSARVYRTSYDGVRGSQLGMLADAAHVANACFALVSAGAAGPWLPRGAAVLRAVMQDFVRVGEDGTLNLAESTDEEGLLTQAQQGAVLATPLDGPEPSSVAAFAQALQAAEALEQGPFTTGTGDAPGVRTVRSSDVLHHLPMVASRAPSVAGGSLLAGRRTVLGSPALRFFSGTREDLAQVRRAGALYGIPVEPVDPAVVGEAPLQVSICLNSPEHAVCLAPSSSVEDALAGLR